MKSKKYKEAKVPVDKVCEPVAMTYGMSESLSNSLEEDDWELEDTPNMESYTLEELHARIAESHQQYLRGEYKTEMEVREGLKREFSWLR